jgi:CubicO group peptidase (beta-lactamase class C family)
MIRQHAIGRRAARSACCRGVNSRQFGLQIRGLAPSTSQVEAPRGSTARTCGRVRSTLVNLPAMRAGFQTVARWWSSVFVAVCIVAVPARVATGETHASAPPLSVSLAAAAEEAASLPWLHSLLVSWHGDVILERYFHGARATSPANIKSASKSVISALIGIAIDRGLIGGVQVPIARFFPEVQRGNTDAEKRGITVENLLTMQSGLETTSNRNYGAWVQSRNWVRWALDRPMVSEPGTTMEYSTGNTHLLSAILTKATGTSTWEFAQQTLAKPLGFTLPQWPQDPQGIYFGGNDMLMTPREMLAFGELYLHRGRANGQQIVPAQWVDASHVARAQSRRESDRYYGYGWWIRELAGRPAYYAWGFGGQFIFIVPDLDLVVVTTSSSNPGDDRRSHRRTVYELVEDFVIAPIAAASGNTSVQSAIQ